MDDLRARILGSVDAKKPAAMVSIPEWDATVWLRRLSLKERLAFEAENGSFDDIDRKKDAAKYEQWLVRYCIATSVTEAGDRLFHPEDQDELASKSATAIEKIVLAALRLNVVSAEEVAALGKPSAGVLNGSSPTGSPAISG